MTALPLFKISSCNAHSIKRINFSIKTEQSENNRDKEEKKRHLLKTITSWSNHYKKKKGQIDNRKINTLQTCFNCCKTIDNDILEGSLYPKVWDSNLRKLRLNRVTQIEETTCCTRTSIVLIGIFHNKGAIKKTVINKLKFWGGNP